MKFEDEKNLLYLHWSAKEITQVKESEARTNK